MWCCWKRTSGAGYRRGRRPANFANTIKYVLMGTSSNFGNMFSAAAASALLPFLPMLPSQILLNNLLYDSSQLAIPTDRVDEEQLHAPSHWNIAFIRRFMLTFGPISSLFDFLTFGLMLGVLHAGATEFRTGWFVESLATQTLIIFAIRTRRVPFFRSRASVPLTITSLTVVAIGVLITVFAAGSPARLHCAAVAVLRCARRVRRLLPDPRRAHQEVVLRRADPPRRSAASHPRSRTPHSSPCRTVQPRRSHRRTRLNDGKPVELDAVDDYEEQAVVTHSEPTVPSWWRGLRSFVEPAFAGGHVGGVGVRRDRMAHRVARAGRRVLGRGHIGGGGARAGVGGHRVAPGPGGGGSTCGVVVGGHAVVGEYVAGALVAVMLSTGRALDAAAQRRASHDLRALLEHAPQIARRRVGDAVTVVPLDQVAVGDLLVVGPGEVVPVDGRIEGAVAVLDESVLTGEPLQVERAAGEPVA